MSGVMSITGDADTVPYRVGYPMADTIGGMSAAFAVAAALANKEEDRGSLRCRCLDRRTQGPLRGLPGEANALQLQTLHDDDYYSERGLLEP
jgi:hypothetical protein